jgi:RNA polymerase sigma factor (sigma-70 family)
MMNEESDPELLKRFATIGDERAFSALVGRHAGMVMGVAWRRMEDWAAAEEIARNVFAILARKARSISHHNLAGWLHHAAVLEARNARRKAARYRQALEQLSNEMMNTPPSTDGSWEEIRPHLDEAMSKLTPEARHFVVMRFLERRSIREIAASTGRNADACRKKIQRSIHLLESLLRKRGLPRGGIALTTVLEAQQLCVSPASATAIAAAALKSAATLKPAFLALQTLSIMNTSNHC